jgi:hypothetical protein
MINQPVRPTTMCVQPSQTMRFIDFFLQAYRYVSHFVRVTCDTANLDTFGNTLFPRKISRIGVIRQKITKFICGHVDSPVLSFNINTGITK